ncbi:isochorismate synthase MenF [Synechococcus sp. PCC 6312]|uniref:isochorismate synthase n=1 Tax=Synechococcus sp. (strain ATCC 27167 / PCC 6312) TaxID=195253 RepID=UPI00029F0060|nr:isochorismate synthase [Synechococcus sp. PCC 6312]AFY61164.1 isochorismate synthase family protein [Synechococcus sp. PCC 6312]
MPVSPLPYTTISPGLGDPEVAEWLAAIPERSQIDTTWVSLTLPLPELDTLVALSALLTYCHSPHPWHFYLEHPHTHQVILGVEVLHDFQAQAPDRFDQIRLFSQQTLADLTPMTPDWPLNQGLDPLLPGLTGTRIFCTFSFFDQAHHSGLKHPTTTPGFPVAWAVLPRWQLAQTDQGTTLTLTSERPRNDQAWQGLIKELWMAWQTLQTPLSVPLPPKLSLTLPNLDAQAQAFQTQVQQALQKIATGTLEKLVLACAIDIRANQDLQGLPTVHHLRQTYPSCYSFSISNGQGQTFIGASPERLVSLAAGHIRVDALAGSAPRDQQAEVDQRLGLELQQSQKDLREHQVIVDFLRQALGEFTSQIMIPTQPTLLRLANIQHLQTLIQAWVGAEVHILDIVTRLHPTPAVAGHPQHQACQHLVNQEDWERGLYAAPLGWINATGEGEFIVGIRSALLSGKEARVYGGAGIVAGSEPEREWEEILLKLKTLLTALTGSS